MYSVTILMKSFILSEYILTRPFLSLHCSYKVEKLKTRKMNYQSNCLSLFVLTYRTVQKFGDTCNIDVHL